MKKLQWERIEGGFFSSREVYRAKVPGGWLVACHINLGGGVTFVPDPDHEWNVEAKQKHSSEPA